MINPRLRKRKVAIAACIVAVVGAGAAVASAATNTQGIVPNAVAQLTLTPRTGPPIVFEVQDYSFDVEQTLSIGSQSSGAGAGKVTFNPFTITTRPGTQTAALFRAMGDGSVFPSAELIVPGPRGQVRLDVKFRTIAPKSLREYAGGGGGSGFPAEDVSFVYGALELAHTVISPIAG